jgi:hypothetical protein
MTFDRHQAWDDTEIAAVPAADLSAAIGLWLARERAGIVLVDEPRFATLKQIEARVIAMHDHPAQGLSVLLRMRSLVDALSLRRFRHLVKPENAAALATLIEVAANQRLNARWGMSPLRLAWAYSAAGKASAEAAATGAEAA